MADIELDNLVVRDFTKVSSEVFKQAVESGEIGENDISFTLDDIHEYVKRDADAGVTMVLGDADNVGARLSLTSRNSAYPDKFDGEFNLTAANDETGSTLCGKPDGTLTWSGNPIEIIVESQLPAEENGYTWYRKYKSGWVEQGGQSDDSKQSVAYTVTLPVPMLNENYTAMVTGTVTGNGYVPRVANRSTTSFGIRCDVFKSDANPTAVRLWYVCGMAA